jgi:hypothetical protein
MRVTDAQLATLKEQGFVVIPGFVPADELAAAQDALWQVFPRPEAYFADPEAHKGLAKGQFAGIRHFPYNIPIFDRLCVLPDLVDAAERFLGGPDIDLYKIELWAKYAGASNYDQMHHRDFGNHTLVVPHPDRPQLTTIMLLSDVTEDDAPTCAVPLPLTRDVPMLPMLLNPAGWLDVEIPLTGPAGTLILYQTTTVHRGSNFRREGASRFIYMTDFKRRGWQWTGKQAWPDHAIRPGWAEAMTAMSVRERDLFGFPPPGSDYWTPETLAGVQARYPAMDLAPYR